MPQFSSCVKLGEESHLPHRITVRINEIGHTKQLHSARTIASAVLDAELGRGKHKTRGMAYVQKGVPICTSSRELWEDEGRLKATALL